MGEQKKPIGLKWRSNTFFILATVGIGLFTDLFLYGLIVPILPFILSSRLHTPESQIQTTTSLLLTVYAGASVLSSIPAGIIADKLPSRRLPFLLGLFALLLATILFSVGHSLAVLVIARILQGISAAVVWTIGLALVLDTVGSEKLGVTIGGIFSFISVGELVAPILGGVLYGKTGVAGVFGLGGAVLGIDFLMRLVVIEKKVAAKYGESIDDDDGEPRGREGREGDEEANEESPLIGDGGQTDDDEKEWKITKPQPKWIRTFPILYCLGDARLLTAQLVAFTQATLISVFDATIPTEAQSLFDVSSLKAGLLFTPLVLPYLLLGSLAGRGVDKYGTKPAATLGFLYLVPILILLRLPSAGGTPEIVKFCVLLAFCGLGLAFISAPSIVEASFVVGKYHKSNKGFFGEGGPYAQLYAINSMVFSAGLTLGPLVAGSLRDKIGYGNMNAVVAGMCLVVSMLSFVFLGGKPRILGKEGNDI